MRKNFSCFLLMAISINLSAQFNDSFSDGNFTADPTWGGNTADWQVITNSDVAAGVSNAYSLRLNVAAGSGTTYLSAHVPGSWGAAQSWGYFVGRRSQAYTAANHSFIWLWASEANLTSPTIDGYRIRIGDDGGGDEIVLQRISDGISTDIIIGTALTNGLTDIGFLLRVTRNNSGVWEIFTSVLPTANGTGAIATDIPNAINANISQGTVTDNLYTNFDNGYIGFVNVYSNTTVARTAQEFDQVQLSFSGAAVPVKLDRFDAVKQGSFTRLTWDASEESNLNGYEIQRSSNGLHFTTIGLVSADNRKKYWFDDNEELTAAHYYRLRMVDADGSSKYSHIVSVKGKGDGVIKINPNPASEFFQIDHPKSAYSATFKILNAYGKVVQRFEVPPNAVRTRINVSDLSTGLYYLIFTAKDIQLGITLIKR